MAALFKSSFFSIAGQKERLSNVVGVLKQSLNPFSKEKPVANVNNKVLKAGLEFVAANPYTSAALVAAPAAASSRALITSSISKAPLAAKIAVAAVAPAVVASPKLQTTIIKTASKLTPEKIVKASVQTGKTIENPTASNIKDLITENKTLLATAAVASTLLVGSKALPAAAGLLQTKAIKEQAEAIKEQTSILKSPFETMGTTQIVEPKSPLYSADSKVYAEPQVLAKTETIRGDLPKKKRKKKAKAQMPSISNKVNVLINNKTSSVGIKGINKYINQRLCYN